jgi:hypothetical protein
MITAYKIKKCAGLDTRELEQALNFMHPEDTIKDSKFLGITNSKRFAYEVLYFDNNLGEDAYTKIFVDLDFNEVPYADY